MKYTLEIQHYYSSSINSGHAEHDLKAVLKSNTLWGLLREAKKNHFEDKFYSALKRYFKKL